ncbi:MAG: hypothetical protein CMI60_09085 [Parvibaculum sp.]|nr:hypothetical protein [Parvibaculum sp.]
MNERKYKPTVLHTSIDGIDYLCGKKREGSWHDRCMTDKFARSLPLCEDCEEVKNQRFGVDTEAPPTKTGITVVPLTTTKNILSSPSIIDFDADAGIYVKDYRRDA